LEELDRQVALKKAQKAEVALIELKELEVNEQIQRDLEDERLKRKGNAINHDLRNMYGFCVYLYNKSSIELTIFFGQFCRKSPFRFFQDSCYYIIIIILQERKRSTRNSSKPRNTLKI